MIEIVEPGPLATAQDLGRPGYAALGAPRSGAFDRGALRLANRLVGNDDDAAGIEVTFGGLAVRFADAATIALTGALCPSDADWGVAVTVPAGGLVRLGNPADGLRSYLAIRGGLALAATLGSRSTDTLSGLGPAPLRAGDRIDVDPASAGEVSGAGAIPGVGPAVVSITFGPRHKWFTKQARRALVEFTWTVRSDADRVGVRLDGPKLRRRRDAELPSEPMLPGAVQVPPDGRPIVFGPDAPVTGGYPVIAVVDDLDRVAQLRPGDGLRFRELRQ